MVKQTDSTQIAQRRNSVKLWICKSATAKRMDRDTRDEQQKHFRQPHSQPPTGDSTGSCPFREASILQRNHRQPNTITMSKLENMPTFHDPGKPARSNRSTSTCPTGYRRGRGLAGDAALDIVGIVGAHARLVHAAVVAACRRLDADAVATPLVGRLASCAAFVEGRCCGQGKGEEASRGGASLGMVVECGV